jgi:ASC-1-like (ASCH) protein
MMLKISINRRALVHIKNGSKKYEIRQKKGIFTNIENNQLIRLYNGDDSTIKTISHIIEANTLDELFNMVNFDTCTPYFDDKSSAINYIHKFYSKKSISSNKFIALNLI